MTDITRILNANEQGDANFADELLLLVYEELRILAAQKISRERPSHPLLQEYFAVLIHHIPQK